MASSGTSQTYSVDGYKDPQYTITEQTLTVELSVGSSSLNVDAKRVHDLEEGSIQSGPPSVGTTVEKVIVSESATLVSGNSSVSGLSARASVASGALKGGDSLVTAAGENVVATQDAELESGPSTVTMVADRVIPGDNLAITNTDSIVNGTAKRDFIVSANLFTDGITFAGSASRVQITSVSILSGDSTVTSNSETGSKGSGVLQAQASTVDGTTKILSSGSGVLISGQSVLSGSSDRIITGSGSIVTDGITVTFGGIERTVNSLSVAIKSSDATITFSVDRVITLDEFEIQSGPSSISVTTGSGANASGTLTTGVPTVAGTAERVVTASGTIQIDGVVVEGTSERTVVASGDLVQGDSKIDAVTSYNALVVYSAEGELAIGPSTVSGTAVRTSNGSGILESGQSTVALSVVRKVSTDPIAIVIGDSTVSGFAERKADIDPIALQAQDASVSAFMGIGAGGSGTLTTGTVTVAGVAERVIPAESIEITLEDSTVSGSGSRSKTSESATLVSGQSAVNANAFHVNDVEFADLVTDESTVSGIAENGANSSGALTTGSSVITGTSERGVTGSGILTNGDSLVIGAAGSIVVSEQTDLVAGPSIVIGISGKAESIAVEIVSQEATVVGVTERAIDDNGGNAIVTDGDSIVVGEGIVGRKSSGQIIVTDESVVTGSSIRTIVGIDTDLVASEVGVSAVVGVGENIVVETDGIVNAQDATVNATVLVTTSLLETNVQSGQSVVSGNAARGGNSLGATLQSGPSSTTGDAELVHVSQGVSDLQSQESTVVGTTVKTSNSLDASIQTSDITIISGIAERTVNASGELKGGDSLVTAAGENIVVTQNVKLESGPSTVVASGVRHANTLEGDLVSDASTTTGSVERQINQVSGILITGPSVIVGIAENTIDQEGDGGLSTGDSIVIGSGVRASNVLNGELSAAEVGFSVVAGVSEREVIDDVELFAQDATVVGLGQRHANGTGVLVSGDADIDAVAEREIDGVSGIEQGGDASVSGISERKVVNIPNVGIVGDLVAFGPDDNGPSLSYVDPYTVLYDGTGEQYQVLTGDKSFTAKVELGNLVAEETSNTAAKDYNIYWRDKGQVVPPELRWDVIFFSTTSGRWYQEEFEYHPAEWSDGQVLEPYTALNTVELTSIDAVRDGGASSRVYSSESFVLGVSENIVTESHADVKSGDASLTSTIKRTLLPATFDYKMPDVTVIGVAERTLNNDGLGQQLVTGPSVVAGVAERTLNNDGSGQQLFSGDATVIGVAERLLNNDGLGQALFSGQSSVDATIDRTVFLKDGISASGPSSVAGISERVIDNKGVTQALTVGESTVAGIGERTLNNDGLGQALFSGPASVSGIAENIHTIVDGVQQVDEAIVTGLSERTVNSVSGIEQVSDATVIGVAERTLNNDGLGQQVQSGPSTVQATLNKVVVRLPDYQGPTALSPDSNQAEVSYVGNDLVISGLPGHLVFYNGIYKLNPVTGSFADSGTGHQYTEEDFGTFSEIHNWYVRKDLDASGGYFWIYYNSTKGAWYASFTTQNPSTWDDGHIVSGTGSPLEINIANANEGRPSGFESMHGDESKVVGLGERTLNNDGLGQELFSGDATVSAVTKITSNLLSGIHMPDGDSTVDGVGKISRLPIVADLKSGDANVAAGGENIIVQSQRPNLKGGASSVSAVVEITSNGSGVLITTPSLVSGVAERELNNDGINHALKSDSSTVTGIAERTINGRGDLKILMRFIYDKGEAERTVVVVDGNLKSGDASTNSDGQNIGERIIVNVPDPDLGESRLYGGNNRPWQIEGKEYPNQPFGEGTRSTEETVRPRVGGDFKDPSKPVVYQTVAFQEAIPIYRRILVRQPRKYSGNRN